MGAARTGGIGSMAAAIGVLAIAGWAGTSAAKDGPKAGEEVVIYEANYGSWTVNCDPCAPADESVCMMWPDIETAGLSVFPVGDESEKPSIGMSYRPMDLAYLSEGTLTVSVDGGPATVIAPPDLGYDELFGSMYIQPHALTELLATMRDGTVASFSYADADGSRTTDIPLGGFEIALDDMLRRLPYPRGTYEPGLPNSCGN